MVAERIILDVWSSVVAAATQEEELLRQFNARMDEARQQSVSASMNAAVLELTEAVRTVGQTVWKPRLQDMRVEKPEPYAPGKDFDDWDFTFKGHAGTLDPAYATLLNAGSPSATVVMATPRVVQQSATLLYLLTMLTLKGARKMVRKAGNNGFEAYRQLCLKYGTSDQEGSTGPFVQIMMCKFGCRIEDVEDRLNEFPGAGETIRARPSENGVCLSNTPEPLKTHLQLSVGKLGNFDALRLAIEDYSRSRRIFKTTSNANTHTHHDDPMEVDPFLEGEGGKAYSQCKEYRTGNGSGQQRPEKLSHFGGECRNWGNNGHKAADCWHKQPKPQGKGKGGRSD